MNFKEGNKIQTFTNSIYNIQDPIKTHRYAKKDKYIINRRKVNKIELEITKVIQLIDKDLAKKKYTNVFIFKDLK